MAGRRAEGGDKRVRLPGIGEKAFWMDKNGVVKSRKSYGGEVFWWGREGEMAEVNTDH